MGLGEVRDRLLDPDDETTAVGLWAMVGVGVLAGTGRLLLAALTAVLILFVLELRHIPGVAKLDARRYSGGHRKDDDPPIGMGPDWSA